MIEARPSDVQPRPPLAAGTVAGLAGLELGGHLLATLTTSYGLHRDEFLYLAMGRHLDLWRMDFPPAIAILAEAARALLGNTLFAVRLFPALAATALVILAAVMARELGGGRAAQGLAALAVLASPVFLRAGTLFQPVVFDQLWWTLGLLALVWIARGRGPHGWILLGVAGGFGLLTKFTILVFGLGVLIGLALSRERRALATPWPYAATGIALAIGSPSLVGQLRLGLPILGVVRDLRETQFVRVDVADFLGGQLMLLGAAFVLAAAGLAFLLRGGAMRPYRAIGWTCLAAFAILLALRGKAYYAAPIYPTLLAAGSVAIRALPGRVARAATIAAAVVIAATGLASLPFGLPLLPPGPMARYAAALGVTSAVTTNRGAVLPLPQDYADMLGWEERVAVVAAVYRALPAAERARAVVLAGNYGEAGAIDFFGPRYGLPRAVSPVGSYWFFGPGDRPGEVAVAIGLEPGDLAPYYRVVRVVSRVDHPWAVPEERDVPITVASSPYRTLQQVWPYLAGLH